MSRVLLLHMQEEFLSSRAHDILLLLCRKVTLSDFWFLPSSFFFRPSELSGTLPDAGASHSIGIHPLPDYLHWKDRRRIDLVDLVL